MASSKGTDYFKPDNPDAPYFAIKIGDTIYDIELNFIESLTIKRPMDDVGEVHFTLVNVMDLFLEERFILLFQHQTDENPELISFQYGWSLGNKSKWYRCILLDFTPEYIPGGYLRLSVNGEIMPDAEYELVKAYKGKSSTEIIEKMAAELDWVIEEMDPAKPFDEERTFNLNNIDPITYITKKIEPISLTTKGEPYRFYAETGSDGKPHIWFISVNKPIMIKNYNFFINMGNYGSVLSWAPTYSGKAMAGWMTSATIDIDTNDVCVYGNEAKHAADKGTKLTVYGSTSPDKMGPLLTNKWYQENIGSYSASLEVVGDPTLKPYQAINVQPMLPNGQPHRMTSGTYQIRQITDTISTNGYTTSMELFKMSEESNLEKMPLTEAANFKGSE